MQGKENAQAAEDRRHQVCASPDQAPIAASSDSVAGLLEQYLERVEDAGPGNVRDLPAPISNFWQFIGTDLTVKELRSKYVTNWITRAKWSRSTKRGAAQTIRTAFRRLLNEGYTQTNPIDGTKGVGKRGRETILTDEQYYTVLGFSRPDFVQLSKFARIPAGASSYLC